MKQSKPLRRIAIGILSVSVVGILGQNGCPPPVPPGPPQIPPTITGAGVSGTLVQGQPGSVEVTATVTDDNTVASVTANLVRIGGSQAQPMILGQNNLWRFAGTVAPPNAGLQRVTIIATDDQNLAAQTTATVNVATTQPAQPGPVITSPTVNGTLTAGVTTTVGVTAIVTPASGTVTSVIADLSQIGGFSDTPLLLTSGNLWSFAGLVTPLIAGTRTVTIEATDSLANTSTATVSVVVNSTLP